MKEYINEDGTPFSKEQFIEKIKNDKAFSDKFGELGPVYGKQWRAWCGVQQVPSGWHHGAVTHFKDIPKCDQIEKLIQDLKTNPDSRRLMVNAWNVGELDSMVLPPCHYGFQMYTRELSVKERLFFVNKSDDEYNKALSNKEQYESIGLDFELALASRMNELNIPTRAISLMWNQRSVDTFLGLPFNIASYGLLLEIIAKVVNMVPDELIGNLGDVHLYSNHVEQATEQIGRELTKEERKKLYENEFTPGMEVKDDEWLESKLVTRNIPKRSREPFTLSKLDIHPDMLDYELDKLEIDMFKILDYQSHPIIKAQISN
jgi:thymidylate synthase